MKTVSATIEDAKVRKISDIWRRKPHFIAFGDTDAVILTLKTAEGRTVDHTFYLRLKADGSFSTAALHPKSAARQRRFAEFLIHYGIAKDFKNYNILKGVEEWKGKKVEIVPYKETGYLYLP